MRTPDQLQNRNEHEGQRSFKDMASAVLHFVTDRFTMTGYQPPMGRDTSHLGVSAYNDEPVLAVEPSNRGLPLG